MDERTGFIFYKSYLGIITALPAEEGVGLLKNICEYACLGKEPEEFSNPLVKAVWELLYQSLKKSRINAENRCKKPGKEEKTIDQPEMQAKLPEAEPHEPATFSDEPEEDPGREYTFEELTPTEKMQELKDREDLEKMGIIVDCCVGEVEPKDLEKPFSESVFLQENFKFLSKIKRHYKKILSGYYKTNRPTTSQVSQVDDYMKHNYSPERLKAALVNFDEWG